MVFDFHVSHLAFSIMVLALLLQLVCFIMPHLLYQLKTEPREPRKKCRNCRKLNQTGCLDDFGRLASVSVTALLSVRSLAKGQKS